MTLRSQFTHNNQNSDGSLTNEQTMIENLIIESIQITGFHGYYLPRKMENIDPIITPTIGQKPSLSDELIVTQKSTLIFIFLYSEVTILISLC